MNLPNIISDLKFEDKNMETKSSYFMNLPNIISDRNMFVLLIRSGLGGCIGLSLFSLMGQLCIPIGIIAPILLTLPIFNTKRYKNIIFNDEKNKQNNNNNILLVSLLVFGYFTSIVLCHELSDYYDFNKYSRMWILITNIVYFLSVLYLFIDKISGK
jgi:hypothetical protein